MTEIMHYLGKIQICAWRRARFAIGASLALMLLAIAPANASDIKIEQAWTRVTAKGVPVGGGFFKITNSGSVTDRLVAAHLPTAGRVEIHKTSMADGVMRMRHMEKGVEIKPGETVTFKPGGLHLMFMMLKKPIKMGKPLRGSLTFEKAGKIAVEFAVAPMGSPRPPR